MKTPLTTPDTPDTPDEKHRMKSLTPEAVGYAVEAQNKHRESRQQHCLGSPRGEKYNTMSSEKQCISFATLALALIGPVASYGAAISFETIPGVGVPTELLTISNQFLASEGVSLEGGGFPVIAQVGCPAVALTGLPEIRVAIIRYPAKESALSF
jgi:hypothetical protein